MGAQNKENFSAKYIAEVLGNTSPKNSITTPEKTMAKIMPFSLNNPTNMAVLKEANPMLTSMLPKTMLESKKEGFLNKYFIFFARKYLVCIRLRRVTPKEKIAVSDAEKKAEKTINIKKKIILINISFAIKG